MKQRRSAHNFSNAYDVLDRIFNNTYNGIAIVNLEGNWLKVNQSICELLGYTRWELCNMDINNIIYVGDLGAHKDKYEQLVSGQIEKYRVKQRYFHKDGRLIWVLIYVSLVYFKEGRPYMIWQFNDVTKRQINQNKLKVMLDVVKEQNERLVSFANIVTHNLRSHSGNLSTLTEFLEADPCNKNDNENFVMLKKAVLNLKETVSHLTEVAKIKKMESSELDALNLHEYVEKAMYNIIAMAQNANAVIYNEIDETHTIKAIPAYLDSIVLNFLTNAIKYRSADRVPVIELSSYLEGDAVVFKIKDNGLGIDMHKYGDKLFQMYKTFHYNEDAVGVGLFITKNHIESIGGTIAVESEVGVGTAFRIHFKSA